MTTTVLETPVRERALAAWHEERDRQREKTVTLAKSVAGRFPLDLGEVAAWDRELPIWDVPEAGVEATWLEFQRRDKGTDRAFWIVDRCAGCNSPSPVIRFTSLAEFGKALEEVANDDVPEWECAKCKKDEKAAA